MMPLHRCPTKTASTMERVYAEPCCMASFLVRELVTSFLRPR